MEGRFSGEWLRQKLPPRKGLSSFILAVQDDLQVNDRKRIAANATRYEMDDD